MSWTSGPTARRARWPEDEGIRLQRDHRSIQHNRRESGGAWPVYQSASQVHMPTRIVAVTSRMTTSGGEEELATGSANTGPAIELSGKSMGARDRSIESSLP